MNVKENKFKLGYNCHLITVFLTSVLGTSTRVVVVAPMGSSEVVKVEISA